MDQMTTSAPVTDNHYMTREYLESSFIDLTNKINQLTNALEAARNINRSNANEMNNKTDAMKTWTFEAMENNTIDESAAEEIAEICGFELSKETEVEVTVTYSLTVTSGPSDDIEDIVNNINFDSIDYDTNSIDFANVTIDRVDF
jgi:hypothetical protein